MSAPLDLLPSVSRDDIRRKKMEKTEEEKAKQQQEEEVRILILDLKCYVKFTTSPSNAAILGIHAMIILMDYITFLSEVKCLYVSRNI